MKKYSINLLRLTHLHHMSVQYVIFEQQFDNVFIESIIFQESSKIEESPGDENMHRIIEPSLELDTSKDIIQTSFLHMPKEYEDQTGDIFTLSKHVQFNTPSLDIIKQIP